ncbi:reverse transcriptase domain-containing protein, partial [Tanacetum coccineum]
TVTRDWLDKEPPRSILTWDDLVSKFINQYFPPSKTTYYRNEIITFYQKPNEAFNEAWERFKGLLRQCPHHGFSELHQLDTFYNSLNSNDQDALDSAAGGNFLDKMPQEDFENYVKANDAVLKNVQNQGQNLQNQMANVTSLLTSLCDNFKNSASTSNSGTLPSQTVTNPRQQINAITTRSGKALEEPSIPLVPSPDVSKPQKEPEQNPETSTEKVQNPKLENTAHVPSSGEEDSIFIEIPKPKAKETVSLDPNPNSYPSKLPYPERMKVREHDKPSAQHSRFLKMFKQLRLEIGLKDALVEMPKFNKWLSSLLRNKEKLEEIAITTVNAECSAIIMNKVPEKLEDPGKFLIPCALQELKRTSALADSGASINLLPHSIYKKLELEALTPTRMTLELANRSISHPMGIAEDVVVRVDGFTFLADFVVVNFEPDPRVPIILGRPFLRTAKALIDLYEEKLTLRVGKDELVYYADKSEKNKEKNFVHAISVIDFSKDDPFSGSTTTHSDDPSPSSSPVKTSDNFVKFADELAPLFVTTGNVNPLFEENDKDVKIKSSSSFTLTSPEESEFEAYLKRDSIPPGIDLTLPPTLKVSSSNPTSPTLTGDKVCSWEERPDSTQQNSLKASRDPVDLSRSIELLILCTDISKITRKQSKTGKHGHENGRVSKSRKKSQAPRLVRSNQEDSLAHSQSKGYVINGRSIKRCGFCSKFTHITSTSEPQTDCQLGNPCELTSDPTAIKLDQMIAMIGWQRLKEVGRGSGPRSFF